MADSVTGSDQVGAAYLAGELNRAGDLVEAAIRQFTDALNGADNLPADEVRHIRLRLADCLLESRDYLAVRRVVEEALREAEMPNLDRARILARRGRAEFFLGELEESISSCSQAVELLLPTSFHDELAQALRWLGHGHRFVGRTRQAVETFRDALAAARRGDDISQQNFCLDALAQASRLQGRYAEAIDYGHESLGINERRGAAKPIAFDCLHIGLSQLYLGELALARQSLDRATRQLSALGDERSQLPVMVALSRLERRLGERDAARTHADRALTLAQESSYKRLIVLAIEELADIALENNRVQEASQLLEAALEQAESIAPDGDLVYEVAWRLGLALVAADIGRARTLAERAVSLAQSAGDRRETGNATVALAKIRLAEGQTEEAVRLVDVAIREFEAIGTPYELANAHEAAAAIGQGHSAESSILAHLLEARRLYSRIGATPAIARLEDLVGSQSTKPSPATTRPVRTEPREIGAIVRDAKMARVMSIARDLAPYETTILLEGETGSGKEVVARTIHDAGPRAGKPFVALNCAAFAANLLESELFGHRRGAFTGAERDHAGRLAGAGDGTILLDEIDKASGDFQAKLLRVIEDRRVSPVGSTETVRLRARILCATNRDLRVLASTGAFLNDLYFRLSAFRLQIPPLRERPDDIAALVRHFATLCRGRFGQQKYEVSSAAMRALVAYPWPGNVRELKNVIESAAFYARDTGRIELSNLPPEVVDSSEQPGRASLPERIERLERAEIELALRKSGGNKAGAARILGVSRKGLLDRLRRLGID